MAPTTRFCTAQKVLRGTLHRKKWTTPKKTRFFAILDAQEAPQNLSAAARLVEIPQQTVYRWQQQRYILGSPANHRTRQRSSKLERPNSISIEQVKEFVDPVKNPLRDQQYEAQIEYFQLETTKRTLRNQLSKHTKNAQRFKAAYIHKQISVKNRRLRQNHRKHYARATIDSEYQFWVACDEAHIDPSSQQARYILREEGTRY